MRITAFLTAMMLTVSMMSLPAVAETENPEAISVNKPIYSTVYGEEGYNGNVAANANDDNVNTFFQSNKGKSTEESLVIDLQAKYTIAYVSITFAGSVSQYAVEVSASEDFSEYSVLEKGTDGYILSADKEKEKFRYVRLRVPNSISLFRVREMTVYSYDKTEDEPVDDKEFTNRSIAVSEGKPILSRLYGEGGFNGFVCANANDGDDKTSFISTPTEEKPVEWIRIDLGESINISEVSIKISREVEKLEISVSNDVGVAHSDELTNRILLEQGEDGMYRLPEEHALEKFRIVEARKASSERVFEVNELTVFQETRDITGNSALSKRVKTDGKWDYSSALTDGNEDTQKAFSSAIIDLEVPSYINNILCKGEGADSVELRAGLFNTDPENMEEISPKMAEDKKYRYICILPKNGDRISLSEIEVNSFDTDILGNFYQQGEEIGFSIENISYDRNETRTAFACAFDEYGDVIAAKELQVDLAPGEKKTESIVLTGSAYAQRCVAFLTKESKCVLGAGHEFLDGNIYVIGGDEEVYEQVKTKELDTAITSETYSDGISLSVMPTGGVIASDKVYVRIYDTENNLIFADLKPVGEGYSFEYHLPFSADYGEYTVKLGICDVFEKAHLAEYTFTKTVPDDTLLAEAIEAFKNTTATNFSANYNKYYKELGVISFGDIPYAAEHLARIGTSFVRAMSDMSKWKKNVPSNISAQDIHDALMVASVIDAVSAGEDSTASLISRYGSIMDNVFDGTENNSEVSTVFKQIKTTSGNIFDTLKLSAVLSHIEGAKTEDIASALEKYADILKVDLSAIKKSGIDIYDIAKRLGNKTQTSWGDGLKQEISAIISAMTQKTTGGSSGGGGGGGSSSGGGFAKVGVSLTGGNASDLPAPSNTGAGETADFKDMPTNHWAASSVYNLYQKGIVAGMGNGLFEPDRPVKRAEFIKMLVAAFPLVSDPNKTVKFSDCNASDWFYPYVDAAVSCKITSGVSEELFSPNTYIKRQDAALMCMNLLNYEGFYDFRKSKDFADNADISDYASEAVGFLSGLSIINGFEDNSFRPYESLTRAQSAVITDALLKLLNVGVSE